MERNQIKPAREAANMTQSQLAKRLGEKLGKPISRQYINQLEDAANPKTSAGADRLAVIASVIDTAALLDKMANAAWQK